MGFNRRKMEDQRRQAADKEAAARRATDAQVLEDAERLIAAWNQRQAKRMPMPFSPTIGAAVTARSFGLPIGGHCSCCIGRCGKRECRQNEGAWSRGSLAGHTGYSLAPRSPHAMA
jgi:hypothetical protein